MQSLPANLEFVRATREFDEHTIPAGLRRSHRTNNNTWGQIVVHEGRLLYRVLEPEAVDYQLSSECAGVIQPGIAHEVKPLGRVRFQVEFYVVPVC